METLPDPAIGPGELRVDVAACGICGSDVMEWYRVQRAPCVLGHEIAGTVAAAGDGIDRFRVGDRVVVTHHVPCDDCRFCRDGRHTLCETLRTTNVEPGGFAEWIRVPALQVQKGTMKLPDAVSFEAGSFVEPLGCVVRGQRRMGGVDGKSVVVVGAGLTGLLHVKLAAAAGAARTIAVDVAPSRLEAATRFGAEVALPAGKDLPDRLRETLGGRLADRVVLCTGVPAAVAQGVDLADSGGAVLYFAPSDPGWKLAVPFNRFWREEIALLSSYGAAPSDLEEALGLIASGRIVVEEMVTHRLPLEETAEGFRLVAEGRDCLKVIVTP